MIGSQDGLRKSFSGDRNHRLGDDGKGKALRDHVEPLSCGCEKAVRGIEVAYLAVIPEISSLILHGREALLHPFNAEGGEERVSQIVESSF